MNRESLHDATLLVLAGLALTAEIGLLLYQMKIWKPTAEWVRNIEPGSEIGQVILRKRSLKVRAASSLTWYPMAEGDRIQAADTLMTGAESTARIMLHGQGELFLEPYTLIHFSERQRRQQTVLAFELNEGTVRLRSKDSVRLAVRDREIQLRPDTEMVVAAGSVAAPPEVLVTKGEVQIDNGEGEAVKMVAGEAFALSADRGLARADTKLTIVSKSPADGARIPIANNGEISFGWDGDQVDVLEWDLDPSFSSASTVPVHAGKVSVSLRPGKYYWRVRRAVAVSAPSTLVVLPGASYVPKFPIPAEVVKAGKGVELTWEPVPEALEYQFEFSTDPALQRKVRREKLNAPKARVGLLKPGKYYWRVRARHADFGEWPASDIYSFTVKNTLAPPKPKGVRILPTTAPAKQDDKSGYHPSGLLHRVHWAWQQFWPEAHAETIARTEAPKLWMEFEWEAAPGAARYRLQIAAAPDFKELLAQLDTDYTTSLVELPDRSEYFWRIASVDEHGLVGGFSQIQRTRREKAKPRPAPRREVAQIPSAPTPIEGLPTPPVEVHTPEPTPPPYLPFHVRRLGVGYGASYWRHGISATNFDAVTNGIPPHRMQLGMHAGVGHFDAELTGSFARLRAVSQDPMIQAFQRDFTFDSWNAELAVWHWRVQPFGVGIRARSEVDYRRSGSETLLLRSHPILGLAVTMREAWSWNRPEDIQLELWAEVVPVGLRRGGGLYARFRADLWRPARELALGLEATAYPHFRTSGGLVTEWNAEASGAVLLRWDIDDGTPDPSDERPADPRPSAQKRKYREKQQQRAEPRTTLAP